MSWDNALGIMSDGVLNSAGSVYLLFESMGFLDSLGNPPVPPAGGGGVIPGGSDTGMTALSFFTRTRLRSTKVHPWEDSTMGKRTREDEFEDELDGQGGDGEQKPRKGGY